MRTYRSGKASFRGTVNFKIGEEYYQAEVYATASSYYQPCIPSFKDGTGQPEESSFDLDEMEVAELCIEGDNMEYTDVTEKYDTDAAFKDAVEEAIWDAIEGSEVWEYEDDFYEYPEDDREPDFD